jgi:hypothetical protein
LRFSVVTSYTFARLLHLSQIFRKDQKMKYAYVLSMTFALLMTTNASAKTLSCIDGNNGEYVLNLEVNDNGIATSVQLWNIDWSDAGIGSVQSLILKADLGHMRIYTIAAPSLKQVGLGSGMDLHVPAKALNGATAEVTLVENLADMQITRAAYRCN